jgi:CBS-domain-containing membrane protein
VGFAVVGLAVPRALGVGYDTIGDVLASRLTIGVVVLVAAGKLVAWWLALGSGNSGGTLAPILLIGASFGSVVGRGLNAVLPGPDVALGAFAVVAMAATFGAATQATFTAIVFVFELTRDYQVILPLMLASVVADLVCSAVNQDSLMTEKLTRRGLRVGRHYGPDPFSTTPVEDIMTAEVVTLPAIATVADARSRFSAAGHGAYPLVDEGGRVIGLVTRADVMGNGRAADGPGEPVRTRARTVGAVAPDDNAQAVLRVMVEERVEHVPVAGPDGVLVGICTRTDLLEVRRRQLHLERRQPGRYW